MAKVSTDSAASLGTLSGTAEMKAQVEARITNVNSAYDKAMAALDGGLFGQSDAERNAAHNVRQFRDDVDRWMARGRAAAASGIRPPDYKRGWDGWWSQGLIFISGFQTQAEFDHATMGAIVETVKEAPATTVKAVKSAARAVEQVGSNVALGILKPVAVVLGVYLALRLVIR